MEAANRGASEAGGKSIGLSIELPHEQFANAYISPELSFNFHYFFMRKLWFAQIAKALIVFPGGFGTMDELWEMLTLLQTGKLAKHNIILIYGRKYWDKVLNWKAMVNWGTINEEEYRMLQFADSVDEAFDHIRAGLEKYHMEVDPFLQAYYSTQLAFPYSYSFAFRSFLRSLPDGRNRSAQPLLGWNGYFSENGGKKRLWDMKQVFHCFRKTLLASSHAGRFFPAIWRATRDACRRGRLPEAGRSH